jgi:hypothetical protein
MIVAKKKSAQRGKELVARELLDPLQKDKTATKYEGHSHRPWK